MIYLVFYMLVILFSQLTLSVCLWRWSCNSLHKSRCCTGDAEDVPMAEW